ncbi:MAG: hypothetical protein AB8B97_26125 [Granulosicoccus sp.]
MLASARTSIDQLLDIDTISISGERSEPLLTERVSRVSMRMENYSMPGWLPPLGIFQSQRCSDAAVLDAATLTTYDIFALSAQTSTAGNSPIKFNVRGT